MKNLFEEDDSVSKRLCKNCGKCLRHFPESCWDELPPGCGFEGWAFQKREEIKQKVRKQKEELLSLELLLKDSDEKQSKIILGYIEEIEKNIKIYTKYGSKNW